MRVNRALVGGTLAILCSITLVVLRECTSQRYTYE